MKEGLNLILSKGGLIDATLQAMKPACLDFRNISCTKALSKAPWCATNFEDKPRVQTQILKLCPTEFTEANNRNS